MKVKCRPEDFRVEEKLRLRIKRAGAHSVYLLEKKSWNTLDALAHLEQRHGLRRLSRAGLKDRYSHSFQYVSTPGKGPGAVKEKNYSLRFVGMSDEPVSRNQLLGNTFRITLRDLGIDEARSLAEEARVTARFGFPNYYDEQRLGSARAREGFIARRLIDGHYNGALKLYLAASSPEENSRTRKARSLIEANWGDWQRCLELAPPEARPAIAYLVEKPNDPAGAILRIPRSLLELFVNAYQAWLWNEIACRVLTDVGIRTAAVPYSLGRFLFYRDLLPAQLRYLSRLIIPASGPGAEFRSDRVARISGQVLAEQGLTLDRLKLKLRVQGLYFKPYERRTIVIPSRLSVSSPEPDELYPAMRKLVLGFFLPSGSYATVLLKRLSAFA